MSSEQYDERADRRRQRADAAAEKARRRVMRPWYQRPWVIAGAVVAVLVALVGIGALGSEDAADTAAVTDAEEQPAEADPLSDDPTERGDAFEDAFADADAEAEAAGGNPDPLPVEDERFAPDDNPPDEVPPPADDDILQIGDGAELTVGGEPSEILTVQRLDYSTESYDEYGSGPRRNVFLIFKVRIDGLQSTSVYEDDFYIVTRNGTRIDAGGGNSWDAVNYDDMLGYAEVNSGQHKTGYVVFDSPVRHGTLEYDPNFEGEPIVSWEF